MTLLAWACGALPMVLGMGAWLLVSLLLLELKGAEDEPFAPAGRSGGAGRKLPGPAGWAGAVGMMVAYQTVLALSYTVILWVLSASGSLRFSLGDYNLAFVVTTAALSAHVTLGRREETRLLTAVGDPWRLLLGLLLTVPWWFFPGEPITDSLVADLLRRPAVPRAGEFWAVFGATALLEGSKTLLRRRRRARNRTSGLLVVSLGILMGAAGGAAQAAGTGFPPALHGVTPYLQGRQAGVVIQRDQTTCGPAAVATLLSGFFGIDQTQEEVAALARPHMPPGRDPEVTGYTLGSLREALRSLGLTSEGYRMELAALVAYQERVGLPLLIHIDVPRPHFALLVGSRAGRFLLADPSWGMTVEPGEAFAASWSGVVLVTLPPPDARPRALRAATRLLQEYLEYRPRRLLAAATAGRWPPFAEP